MKTIEEVNKARTILCDRTLADAKKLTKEQLALLAGMLNALVWVADGPNSNTMESILAGEPFAVRK